MPSFVRIDEREIVPCPASMLPEARTVISRRLKDLLTEIAALRHRALEVAEPVLAARLGALAPPVRELLNDHKERPR